MNYIRNYQKATAQKWRSLLLIAFSSLLLIVTAAQAHQSKMGGNLSVGLKNGGSSDNLDPALSTGGSTYQVMRALGEWLVEIDEQGAIVPRLASKITSANAGKTWHFTIRSNVKFHNGQLLSAQDVLKTMQRHADEASKSGALGIMRDIESMSVKDNIFSVHLKTANADLPYLMSDYHLMIQAQGGVGAEGNGIGTGPYRLVSQEPGVRYKLEKFADYWDKQRGFYDSYEVFVINDDTARTAALQSGKVQAIDYVNPKTAKLLNRSKKLSIEINQGKGHAVFLMHTDKPPFDNNDLRMALKHAVNRTEMVSSILRGFGSFGNDSPINVAYPFFDASIEQREFDLEKAKAYYKKSGHNGEPIVLHVSDVAFSNALDAAQLFQQSAMQAGIPIEIQREPNGGYWSEVWNKKTFVASYWGGRSVQDEMWSTAYLSSADWNDTRFNNPEFDALLVQARAELDGDKRRTIYGKMSRIVRDQGGVINIMFYHNIDGVSNKIAGWKANPEGYFMNGFIAAKTWFK